uniref:RNA-binding protein 45 n=1 Tax=Rhizophora mucronata TaxID=61149 RepID=A0A2P2M2M6_RHIMU
MHQVPILAKKFSQMIIHNIGIQITNKYSCVIWIILDRSLRTLIGSFWILLINPSLLICG